MSEEYQQQQSNTRSQNWWSSKNNPSGRGRTDSNRYESGSGSRAGDPLVRSDYSDSVSGSSTSQMFLKANQKLSRPSLSGCAGGGGELVDPNLQIMGLGLSSQGVDWDQALLRGGKADVSSFRSMLQEDQISSSTNFQHENLWKLGKIYTEESSLNRSGFSSEQPQFSSPNEENSTITCHKFSSGYVEMTSSILYGGSPSSMLQTLLGPDTNLPQQQFFEQRSMEDYYGMTSNESQFFPPSSFASDNKFPQFRNSPPEPQPPSQNQLQFCNNTPYWNASSRVLADARASVMPALQPQIPRTNTNSSFEGNPKNNVKEVDKDSSVALKKRVSEASSKRPRIESSSSALPVPFKVKKEKMGDRITTLQQLVSPFGKTDTASVLSESIEYIKILHEQVLVLTAPYLKSGEMMEEHHHQHHQHLEKSSSRDSKGPKQDLGSRGLCLVPLSSTFPVTHETSVDFWTPTFGGPLR